MVRKQVTCVLKESNIDHVSRLNLRSDQEKDRRKSSLIHDSPERMRSASHLTRSFTKFTIPKFDHNLWTLKTCP